MNNQENEIKRWTAKRKTQVVVDIWGIPCFATIRSMSGRIFCLGVGGR